MSNATADAIPRLCDPVSNVLKWILLAVGIACFSVMAWATGVTYQTVPPQPERYVSASGALIMSGNDVVEGKAGFQKADLMDYGSLYGMGHTTGQITPPRRSSAWRLQHRTQSLSPDTASR